MAKPNKAGAIKRDLPWWFELYHIAWMLFFPVMWYFFGVTVALITFFVVCAAYVTFA
jgi:hypothetical protein